jgi:hypothetical protein
MVARLETLLVIAVVLRELVLRELLRDVLTCEVSCTSLGASL